MDTISINKLYKSIKQENKVPKGRIIAKAFEEIDTIVSNSVVDDAFYTNYYKQKISYFCYSTIFPNILLGFLTGFVVSIIFIYYVKALLLSIIMLTILAPIVLIKAKLFLASVPICILRPYMLKRMEEKIDSSKKH